jgi:hypothetical protein
MPILLRFPFADQVRHRRLRRLELVEPLSERCAEQRVCARLNLLNRVPSLGTQPRSKRYAPETTAGQVGRPPRLIVIESVRAVAAIVVTGFPFVRIRLDLVWPKA